MRPRTDRRRALGDHLSGDRALWWYAFLAYAALGTLWALSSPLLSVPDEPGHAIKAAAVANGQFGGRGVLQPESKYLPARLDTYVRVPQSIANAAGNAACFAFNPRMTAGCAPGLGNDSTMVEAVTEGGTYPPAFYLLVGWPSRFLDGKAALYGMRLCSVVIGAALLASGLASARRAATSRFTVAGAALAATPMAFFLIGSINPSGMEIAAAFATWLAWLELLATDGRPSTRLLVRVAVVSSAFIVTRPLSPAFFGLALVTVFAMAATRARLAVLRRDRRVLALVGAIGVVAALSVAWILLFVSDAATSAAPVPGLTVLKALPLSYDQLWWRTRQLFGVFGWLDTTTPVWITLGWLIGAGVLVAVALVVGTWRQRIVMVVLTAAAAGLPVLIEASSAPRIGFVWQGRYSLPLVMGVPLLGAWVTASRLSGDLTWHRWTRRLLLWATVAGVVAGQFVAQAAGLSRYVVGQPSSFLAYLSGSGWTPPLGLRGLLWLAVGTTLAYGVVLVASGHDARPTTPMAPPTDDELARMLGSTSTDA